MEDNHLINDTNKYINKKKQNDETGPMSLPFKGFGVMIDCPFSRVPFCLKRKAKGPSPSGAAYF